ncbi:Chromosome partition protein Smc [Pandoraea cepalis]|uniref:Chromosome partition protein Smc n=2 Tax=Pandoraea cepalis TaxID=2508294 RepID=A0A5E4YBC8_9BURK|nr:Chromosome partition protein Smc [Pandoraea cepalis]
MYRYGFAPGAGSWPQPKCTHGREAVTYGKSIAEKHAEIVGQFRRIANAKAQLGLDCGALSRLESAFFSTYKKATSGYWGGGLWDGVYRYVGNPSRSGPYCQVGEQLNDHDVDSLTPSARRFSAILGHLTEALRKEQEILAKCLATAQRSVASSGATFDDRAIQMTASQSQSTERADSVAEIERCLAGVRESIALATKEVWPERKHYGKRVVMTSSLYSAAAAVAVAGLFLSGGLLGVVATVMTLVIRGVSLGSIRGFDRERGWKSVESLLASTKQFIETEGTMMRSYLDVADRRAALERESMVWNLLTGIKTGLGQVNSHVDSLDSRAGVLSTQMATVANRMDGRLDGITGQVNTLTHRFDGFTTQASSFTDQAGKLTGQVGKLTGQVDNFTGQVGKLTGKVDNFTGQFDHLAGQVDNLTGQVDNLTGQVGGLTDGFGKLTDQVDNLSGQVGSLTDRFGKLTDQVGSLSTRLDGVTGQVDTLTNRLDTLSSEVAAGFANTDAKFESFRKDLQRLTRVQEMMAARLALMPYPAAAPRAERRGLTRTNSLSALSDAAPRMA